ncbi:MAG: putative chromosome segregation DNA-binding protein [Candidatus Midichloriaceae bacterium]|jgi:ParB family chromosome partitioning protein|nr:putative chromosome segregation DNA-binding protein [Candidatus Midichloriaceae bacterium]
MQLSQVKRVKSDYALDINKVNPPSELTRDFRIDVLLLPVEKLNPYELQARKEFDDEDIANLADTIKEHGIRNPLTVIASKEDNCFEIVSGERRWRAAKTLGMDRVPCIILENVESAQEIALIENIQRKDLHIIELLEGIEALIHNNPTLTKEELYFKLGISKAYFYKILNLAKLTKEVRQIALKSKIPMEKLINIAKAHSDIQLTLITQLTANNGDISVSRGATVQDSFNRAINKKAKVIELKIKENHLEIDTNLYILSRENKLEAIAMLKRIVEELEREQVNG